MVHWLLVGEAARRGALWVSPRSAMTKNPRYKVVFDQLMGEFSKETGLPALTANAAVLTMGVEDFATTAARIEATVRSSAAGSWSTRV